MRRSALALALSISTGAGAMAPVAGQEPAASAPVLRAEATSGEIVLDGRLNDAAWAEAEPATGLIQSYPAPGTPASFPTEVRILYRGDALYVGIRAFDPDPAQIAAPLARRDATGIYSDWVNVVIDSYLDRRTAFGFAVNPRGVQRDILYSDDVHEDIGWDAVWSTATRVDSLGWVAELRIPFSQLRFGRQQEGERTWGLQVQRDVARLQERSSWAPWTRESPGFVSRFGTLTGIAGIPVPQQLELLPYVSSRVTRAPGDDENPFYSPTRGAVSAGADLRYGLPGGLTLTATLNPDFGQVEVDPAVVNLSAFETFFPERRPFFVEGIDIFRFGGVSRLVNWQDEEFFYTRRIGRTPQRAVSGPEVVFTDIPPQTTILGAAKVSGRLGPWSIGAMNALTGREDARVFTSDGDIVRTPVEPLSNYLVGRLQRDFRGGNSAAGGMVTATNRLNADSVFDPLLHTSAYFAGADFRHSWLRRTWTLTGYLGASRAEGSPAAIARTQRAPARYFQQPDAGHVELDPARTDLTGHMGRLSLQRNGPWFGTLDYKEASPSFVISDLGFQERTDYRNVNVAVGRQATPGGLFRNYMILGAALHAWNFGGTRIDATYLVGTQGTFANYWGFNAGVTLERESFDDRLTRGGPLARSPRSANVSVSLQSDPRRPFAYGLVTKYERDASGASERVIGIPLSARPSPNVRLRLQPTLSRRYVTGQFVRSVADPLAEETFGRRYVFADVDRTTLILETRLDWTFAPNLSLELFAQPFIASGDFRDFKEFAAPGTFDFAVYGRDRGTLVRGGGCANPSGEGNLLAIDPDAAGPAPCFTSPDPSFNFRSLRGNAVARWEFRPGSTLFFVWQQRRESFAGAGDFALGRDLGDLVTAPAENVFLVKLTYWLAR